MHHTSCSLYCAVTIVLCTTCNACVTLHVLVIAQSLPEVAVTVYIDVGRRLGIIDMCAVVGALMQSSDVLLLTLA